MTEQIRSIEEILNDLFKGNSAAVRKYAKVRFTQYEMSLWSEYGLPLGEVSARAKRHFSERFLKGVPIREATNDELNKAFKSLYYAVYRGCHDRCVKLVKELNEAFTLRHIPTIENIENFLNWLTFFYETPLGYDGKPLIEKPYGFEIRRFENEENLREFWAKTRSLLKKGKMLSILDICRLVTIERRAVQIEGE